MKRAKIIVMNARSCNALLNVLLICIHRYIKSVFRYIFLIFDTCYRVILYSLEQKCDGPWLFFEANRGQRAKFGKHWYRPSESFPVYHVMLVYLLKVGLEILEKYAVLQGCRSYSFQSLWKALHYFSTTQSPETPLLLTVTVGWWSWSWTVSRPKIQEIPRDLRIFLSSFFFLFCLFLSLKISSA
jgi:hypothetical protein